MANLISPGVSATIVDESFFIPGRVTTLPVIFIATADEKTQEDGESPALGTYEYGVYREVTNIRQSIELYGIPRYIESEDDEAHHGDARNEYGLDALNKFLEIGNRAYVVRANVNLDDRIEVIRELWDKKITDASEYLCELIEEYIEEWNAVNDEFPISSDGTPNENYKTSVTEEELKELLDEALSDIFDSYTFSSKTRTGSVNKFAEDFLTDHDESRPAFQEVIFDTASGILTSTDTTSLEDGTMYGFSILTDMGTEDVVVDGGDASTFGDLIDEINNQLTESNAELVAGRIRFKTEHDGTSATILIQDGNPSGVEELISNLTLFLGVSEPVDGRGPMPLNVYMDGFDEQPTEFWGLYNAISEEATDSDDEFTCSNAQSVLITAAEQYSYTNEFRKHTSLGSNDQERREEIVTQLRASINDPNIGLRNPDAFNYNLVACPGYKEVAPELIRLSEDMLEEVFVMGETPMDKPPIGFNGISEWATTSERESNAGIAYWYPHGLSSNIDGNEILTTASATALRVFAFNDRERDLWWAPAGTQRGQVNHVSDIGYVSGTLGGPTSFVVDDIDLGARNSLYEFPKNINPISHIEGRGHLVMGQKTASPVTSARESINVERLLRFIKRELRRGVFPYLFEPNDQITRNQVKSTVDSFLSSLVNGRALYDYATICDETNNTPDRIDRKELWIDVALQPVRAIEFIYVPIRVVSTGTDLGTIGSVVEPNGSSITEG